MSDAPKADPTDKYRSASLQGKAIAMSISFEKENLLARGMSIDHLKELVRRVVTPLLRQGASLVYGGHWVENEENLTYLLLRIITAEQDGRRSVGSDGGVTIGKLYNYSAWPSYLDLTPKIEAQWIHCCRIVRISQQQAGFAESDVAPDAEEHQETPRSLFNTAVALNAMRRLKMFGVTIETPDVPEVEQVPEVAACIVLGGKVTSFSGLVPGIFEEALYTLRCARPLYILGGFGGAGEVLANAILAEPNDPLPREADLEFLADRNPKLRSLLASLPTLRHPRDFAPPEAMLAELFEKIREARVSPEKTLCTGLSREETRELLKTNDISVAVRLIRKGLGEIFKLGPVAA